MNTKKLILYVAAVLLAGSWSVNADSGKAPSEWKLIWADEFDKDGKPDPAKWKPENTGFLRNKEEQWYTDSLENAFVKDGFLHLVAKKVDLPNPWYKPGSANWKFNRERIGITSAGLITSGLFVFQYGRVEMRARMPKGRGVWPAFWMIGTDKRKGGWPAIGEVDIFEYMGREPGKSKVQAAVHWKNPAGKYQQKNKQLKDVDLSGGFHLFAMEWDADKMVFSLDGKEFFTFPIAPCSDGDFNAFRAPHFLLVNLAVGGTLGGKVDPGIFPAEYLIDYIRVYQKK